MVIMFWKSHTGCRELVIHSMGSKKKTIPTIIGLVIFFTILLHATYDHTLDWFDSHRGSPESRHDQTTKEAKNWSLVQLMQVERRERLKQSCAALGYSQRFVITNLDRTTLKKFSRIHVIPELKAIYCPIPKVASTSWRRLLLTATNKDASNPVTYSKRVFPKLSSFPLRDARRILKTYTTFLFVRNPYARILSAYKDKLFSEKARFRELLESWYKQHDPQEVKDMNSSDHFTFKQFIKHYIESDVKNAHWEDMMELCYPCEIKYNFIGHLETLKDDSDYLVDLLNIPDGVIFPNEKKPQTNSSREDTLQIFYSQLADGQYKDLSFSQGLARDALLFGYDTPESIKRV